MRTNFGPTGEFPEGRLNKSDEGAIKIGVGVRDGQVFIEFGSPVRWLAFGPDMAEQLAASLLLKAKMVREGK